MERIRPVNSNFKDGRGFYAGGILESEIEKFCKPCDFLQEDNSCSYRNNNQAHSAFFEECRTARVEGSSGIMKRNGFKPYVQKRS